MQLSDDEATRPPPPHRPREEGFSSWAGPVVLTYLLVGTMVFSVLEGWSPRDALYFCVTALTTVGYGDLVPTSSAGKLFCCFACASSTLTHSSNACSAVISPNSLRIRDRRFIESIKFEKMILIEFVK